LILFFLLAACAPATVGSSTARTTADQPPAAQNQTTTGTVQAPAVAAVQQSIDDNPTRLLRLDYTSLASLMGPAHWMRQEERAEVWQYRHAGCVLNIYLYDRAGLRQVTLYELMDESGELLAADAVRRACFRDLLNAG